MAKKRKKIGDEGLPSAQPRTQSDAGVPRPTGDMVATAPDRDRIEARAYELYLARGRSDGAALDDWLNAERELNPDDRRTTD